VCSYDPALYNDRLLLGLKGTMSEAELHIMRARLDQGRWNKAKRGELGFNMPRGYLKRPSGEVCLDPKTRFSQFLSQFGCNQKYASGLQQ
jgi:DNA invertase Pin-like site-specific DNA recombinase